ncbi:MAG: RNA polymerase sigma factor [Akkermansiaceae bacterium]|nr:RNA polymerase sigma factor [Armatimonadota bacterium]
MPAVVNESGKSRFDATTERQRLLRVCYRFTGNVTVAEDLAQEAILIGLRRASREGAPPREWSSYLFGVARRLCAGWQAKRGKDESNFVSLDDDAREPSMSPDISAPDPLESLLLGERERLIERALFALKDPVRQLLLARYVEDLPVREIGERWGISENAATVRIHRGRDALRKVLETTLRAEASAHGLLSAEAAQGWRETTLFCCRCGRERLQGRFVAADPGAGQDADFMLRCPACPGMLDGMTSNAAPMDAASVLTGVQGFRAGLNRVNRWWQEYLADALETRATLCPRCGHVAQAMISDAPESPGMGVGCPKCNAITFYIHPTGLLYHSEQAQAFWRRFPRVRNQAARNIVCEGRPAILTAFADRATAARIEMVFDLETLRCLRVDMTK